MAAGRSLITIEVQAIAALLILIIGAVIVVPIVFISIAVSYTHLTLPTKRIV